MQLGWLGEGETGVTLQPGTSQWSTVLNNIITGASSIYTQKLKQDAELAAQRRQPITLPTSVYNVASEPNYLAWGGIGVGTVVIGGLLLWYILKKK